MKVKGYYSARFPLSRHEARTHFENQVGFDNEIKDGYTPEDLRMAYSYNPSFSGKGVKIAIISAFDNVGIEQNLETFCEKFSLPKTDISVYYPDGRAENTSREWLIESSLDTQWTHVFAPDSELFVVFSKDSDISSLVSASEYAQKELSADIICMCFGTRETSLDSGLSGFMKDGGIFLSSSGDTGGSVSFPSTSPFCISVGGSNLSLSPSGKRISETAWKNGGGGKSDIFDIPFYQGRFFNIYGMTDGKRGVPDVSMMANFSPGAPVYVSQLGGWTNVGGTSLACACFAGVCACIKEKYPEIRTSTDMLSFLYNKAGGDGYEFPQYNFYDITVGKSGNNYAERGYDFATGLGSPAIRQILL